MNKRAILGAIFVIALILSVSVSVARILEYYGKIEGTVDVSCNPDYPAWCEGNTAIGCDVNGDRTETICEAGCEDGICNPIPTPVPTL